MNKFLKLIEQSLPDEDKQLQYTVLEKIANVFSKALKGSPGIVVNAEYPDKLIFGIDRDKVIFTLTEIIDGDGDGKVDPEEDAEDTSFKVDKEVEKLAAKASSGAAGLFGKLVGTGPQRAKAAIKQREAKVTGPAIDYFNKETDDLVAALQVAKANTSKKFNIA